MLSTNTRNSYASGGAFERCNGPGFVFLDRSSRAPIEGINNGSPRTVITLSKSLESNFPLMLPTIGNLEEKKAGVHQNMSSLSFRSVDDEDQCSQSFFLENYNEDHQRDAKRKILRDRKDRIELLQRAMHHFDPLEQGHLRWAGNPTSPAMMTPSAVPMNAADSSKSMATNRSTVAMEGKSPTEQSSSRVGMGRLQSNKRINHGALAA